MHLHLGCIADDLTGGGDLGLMLAQHGLPTTLFLGVPPADTQLTTSAAVIALKIRTVPADVAVQKAREAADWLIGRDAEQLFYKYCSTFDSTANGNIGPVCDALLDRVGDNVTVLLPAFPANGRTVRKGHLLVNGVPLSESSMRQHPLTPMTDSFLPNLMDAQTTPGSTGVILQYVVDQGADSVATAIAEQRSAGRRYIAIDSSIDADLDIVAEASSHLKLLTGASGIGAAIPNQLRRAGKLDTTKALADLPKLPGHAAILAGSCSAATREQVSVFKNDSTAIQLDPITLAIDAESIERVARDAVDAALNGNVLIYSSADPESLQKTQHRLGKERAAEIVEGALAQIARRLSAAGVRKFIAAGGETSGAIAESLGMTKFDISTPIDPGVPWLVASVPKTSCVAFKSGNFGQPDFFQRALDMLP